MTRLNCVLLLAVLASALYVVHMQYESRRLFIELDRAQATARQLATDKARLQVEKRSQATPLRIEQLAKSGLGMRTATPAITQYVSYQADGTAVQPAVAASAPVAGRLP